MGFPGDVRGEERPANARDIRDSRDAGLISGSGRFPGGGRGNPLQYSCLKNPMDREAWWATVHRVTRVRHPEATEHAYMHEVKIHPSSL